MCVCVCVRERERERRWDLRCWKCWEGRKDGNGGTREELQETAVPVASMQEEKKRTGGASAKHEQRER